MYVAYQISSRPVWRLDAFFGHALSIAYGLIPSLAGAKLRRLYVALQDNYCNAMAALQPSENRRYTNLKFRIPVSTWNHG